MIYAPEADKATTIDRDTLVEEQERYVLMDHEVITLAKWALQIEQHYQKSMNIEWAEDGVSNELFITQARPETVHQTKNKNIHIEYQLLEEGKIRVQGNAVGSKIKVGKPVLLNAPIDAK